MGGTKVGTVATTLPVGRSSPFLESGRSTLPTAKVIALAQSLLAVIALPLLLRHHPLAYATTNDNNNNNNNNSNKRETAWIFGP